VRPISNWVCTIFTIRRIVFEFGTIGFGSVVVAVIRCDETPVIFNRQCLSTLFMFCLVMVAVLGHQRVQPPDSMDFFARLATFIYPHKFHNFGTHFVTVGDDFMKAVIGLLIPELTLGTVYSADQLWLTSKSNLELISPSPTAKQRKSLTHLMSVEKQCFWDVLAFAHFPNSRSGRAIEWYKQSGKIVVSIHGCFHQGDESEVLARCDAFSFVDVAVGDPQPSVPIFLSPDLSGPPSAPHSPSSFGADRFSVDGESEGGERAIAGENHPPLPLCLPPPPRLDSGKDGRPSRAVEIVENVNGLEDSLPRPDPHQWVSRFDNTSALEEEVARLEARVEDYRWLAQNTQALLNKTEFQLKTELSRSVRLMQEIGRMVNARDGGPSIITNYFPPPPTTPPKRATKRSEAETIERAGKWPTTKEADSERAESLAARKAERDSGNVAGKRSRRKL